MLRMLELCPSCSIYQVLANPSSSVLAPTSHHTTRRVSPSQLLLNTTNALILAPTSHPHLQSWTYSHFLVSLQSQSLDSQAFKLVVLHRCFIHWNFVRLAAFLRSWPISILWFLLPHLATRFALYFSVYVYLSAILDCCALPMHQSLHPHLTFVYSHGYWCPVTASTCVLLILALSLFVA